MKRKYKYSNGISLNLINLIGIIVTAIFSIILIVTIYLLADRYHSVNNYTLEYVEWEKKADGLKKASDYLTDEARFFVIKHDRIHLDNYFNEINIEKRRDIALESLKDLNDDIANKSLNNAMAKSNELMQNEFHAMRIIAQIEGFDINILPNEIKEYNLTDEELTKTDEELLAIAIELVFGNDYVEAKDYINLNVNTCLNRLDKMMLDKINVSTDSLKTIMIFQQAVILLFILLIITFFLISYLKIVLPLNRGVNCLINDDLLRIEGISEYKYFAFKYNEIRTNENARNVMLEYSAEHDKLTGLYNRTGYELVSKDLDYKKAIFILIDIDNFKLINDKFGHATGDLVIKRVADVLLNKFDKNNYITRLGGDEFLIIIKNAYLNDLASNIQHNVTIINDELSKSKNNTPGITLSFGVASGNNSNSLSNLFDNADQALYGTKRNGKSNVTFHY